MSAFRHHNWLGRMIGMAAAYAVAFQLLLSGFVVAQLVLDPTNTAILCHAGAIGDDGAALPATDPCTQCPLCTLALSAPPLPAIASLGILTAAVSVDALLPVADSVVFAAPLGSRTSQGPPAVA